MPLNKTAHLRYRIIDRCIRNKRAKFPNVYDLQRKITGELGGSISLSSINKDISEMRSSFGAPIQFNREQKGYYYDDDNY